MTIESIQPKLLQLSHKGLAEKVAAAHEYQKRNCHPDPSVLARLTDPNHKSHTVSVQREMILVHGTEGDYSFDFEVPETASNVCYLDIVYSSGDVRKLLLTLNGKPLKGEFCEESTGGYSPEHFKGKRYGPFELITGTNRLHVTTSHFWFPHVHQIVVIDAFMADQLPTKSTSRSLEPINSKTWIVPPSQPLRPDLANILLTGFCSLEGTQDPNPTFVPDPSFYNAINCDGLWVCASRECKLEVLHRACELVCRYVPIEIRRACLQWRAPKGRPLGPFRLVILDHVTNQKAGDCPEFPDDWGGRNGTSNPACFTSASDLDWNESRKGSYGELTVHEMTHLIDMVIRQQIDPYFMQQVEEVWQASRHKYKKAYAYSDRHEYLAEICTLFVGCCSANFKRGCSQCAESESGYCDYAPHASLPPGACGVHFSKKSDLRLNDPDGYNLLKTFLIEIRDPEDDTLWWEDQN